ncbi:MAG: class I SAM-dependent methyltransferase [Deltaproteobacteria bacterium]|nr:class I SAM-dependent methyltransferase [Deltaproteobacteria bacterium]
MSEAELLENWTLSSRNYSEAVREELASERRAAWESLIRRSLPETPPSLSVLDAGCGPGFFSVILAGMGHRVTAVDLTPAMIKEAGDIARDHFESLPGKPGIEFVLGDAAALPDSFESRFDAVISRNLCWGLANPERTYEEWLRVLKPGGRAVIFDHNWNLHLFDPELNKAREADLDEFRRLFPEKVPHPENRKMLSFRKKLPLTRVVRPAWDMKALETIGFSKISLTRGPFPGVLSPEDELQSRSSPMFRVTAERPL